MGKWNLQLKTWSPFFRSCSANQHCWDLLVYFNIFKGSLWFILIFSSLVTNQTELLKRSYIFLKNDWFDLIFTGLSYMVCRGHGGDLDAAGFVWHFLPSSQEIVHVCTRSSLQQPVLLPRGPRRLKTIIMSQFSTLGPQTRSEQVEASSLSEWVQIVMAKLTGVIRDHESVSSPSASLYTVQTQAITQAVRHLKELFFVVFNRTLSWGGNGQITQKRKEKKKAQSQKHHHHTLAVSTHRLGQKEPGGHDPYGLALLGFRSVRSPPVAYWNLRRSVLTTRHKAQTVWMILAGIFLAKTYCVLSTEAV